MNTTTFSRRVVITLLAVLLLIAQYGCTPPGAISMMGSYEPEVEIEDPAVFNTAEMRKVKKIVTNNVGLYKYFTARAPQYEVKFVEGDPRQLQSFAAIARDNDADVYAVVATQGYKDGGNLMTGAYIVWATIKVTLVEDSDKAEMIYQNTARYVEKLGQQEMGGTPPETADRLLGAILDDIVTRTNQ